MEHSLVPFHVSIELRRIGFNDPCVAWFVEPGKVLYASIDSGQFLYDKSRLVKNSSLPLEICTCPTYEQVFDWFENTHGMYLSYYPDLHARWVEYNYQIRWYLPKEQWTFTKKYKLYTNVSDGTSWKGDGNIKSKKTMYCDAIDAMIEITKDKKI